MYRIGTPYSHNYVYDRKEDFVCVRSAHGSRAGRVEGFDGRRCVRGDGPPGCQLILRQFGGSNE